MKESKVDLSSLEWTLCGTMPYAWRNAVSMELGLPFEPEIGAVPARIPGSVQQALINAGVIDDWRLGMNARNAEWIEHRHWVYTCVLPASSIEPDCEYSISCEGLDYSGWVYVNSTLVGEFNNSFVPYRFDITSALQDGVNELRIIFGSHPTWLGQLGYTSRITEWKPRFYYTWDWIPRVVQTAVTGRVWLERDDVLSIDVERLSTDYDPETELGTLSVSVRVNLPEYSDKMIEAPSLWARFVLEDSEGKLSGTKIAVKDYAASVEMQNLPCRPWWPNGVGEQNVYRLSIQVFDERGESPLCVEERTVGFKHIQWKQCLDAPSGADPWICEINGKSIFLQGVNWTPILPTFADVDHSEVEHRIKLYHEMGCNLLRVWGGAVLESDAFYSACTRFGILVWQELPLSSSGIDNWPPESQQAIEDMLAIAASYIKRRSYHVSLLLWSGGNELQGNLQGGKEGTGKPIDYDHPMMQELRKLFAEQDGVHRFIATSPMGPRFMADPKENGLGLHWSVHGPWNVKGTLDENWTDYWRNDDSLFRAETGCPGATSPEVMDRYLGDYSLMPITLENPIWGRTSWWIEFDVFKEEHGHDPSTAEEYCTWSQERQARALGIAVRETKNRFPRIGGIIIWMGHDCFPCAANTSIIDVEGNPKPAYYTIRDVFCD